MPVALAEIFPSIKINLHPENGRERPLTDKDLIPGNHIQFNEMDYLILSVFKSPNGKDRHPASLALLQTPGAEDSDFGIKEDELKHVTSALQHLPSGLWRKFIFPEVPTVKEAIAYLQERGIPQIPGEVYLKNHHRP